MESQYTLLDLADDALAILDHLNIRSAHLVGFSLGGGVAYVMAGLKAPDRVASLALISTTAVGPSPQPADGVPGIAPELKAKLGRAPMPTDWHNREQVVRFLCYFDSCMSWHWTATDEAEAAEAASRVFDRAEQNGTPVNTIFNQSGAAHTPWPRAVLKSIDCPTVIIHGKHDQNVPLPHAELLHKEIRESRLVIVDDIKHELPRRAWQRVIGEVLDIMQVGAGETK
jgi:pimeloyl-ACP methyl ester carboxylesterase